MRQLKTTATRGCTLCALLLLSACSDSGTQTASSPDTTPEPDTIPDPGTTPGQALTHALLNGTWETGCIIDTSNAGTSFTLSDIYLNGDRTSEKISYSDVLCTTVSSMQTVNASYVLGDTVAIDASINGLSSATRIEFTPDNTALSTPLFDLIAIKNATITELYTGDVSAPATDGSSAENSPLQLTPLPSAIGHDNFAEVVSVTVSGAERSYTIAANVLSPDVGCSQYADWWEIISESGELIHRRILRHSHVDEQPFSRASEQPVDIFNDQVVIIRAHLNAHALSDNGGYSTKTYKGSVSNGFTAFETEQNFAPELANQATLPESCLF